MLGLFLAICCSLIIVFGPFIRALQDKDWHEIAIDVFLLVIVWFMYFVGNGFLIRLLIKVMG